jgi:2'-5' RNA ligase
VPRPPADADAGSAGAIRAFFAVELDAPARAAAAALLRALRAEPGGDAVSWVRPESLHVTLRFLGNVERARIPALARAVAERTAPLAPFRIRFGEVSGFPSPRRPRVVALALAPEAPLVELAAAVERGVVAAGLPAEDRPFRAHLTLGRVRGGRRPVPVTAPVTAAGQAFDVAEAVLFRSELGRSGSRYTALERMPLAGEATRDSHHP